MTDNQQPRTCKVCGQTKAFELFAIVYSKNKRGENYRQHTCKECAKSQHAERMRKARLSNPEKYRIHQREHRSRHLELVREQRRQSGMRLKQDVMNAYGGKCQCCGEYRFSMMTIDHIHENGAAHRNELNGGFGRDKSVDFYRWLKFENFPSGFQVLCYNCNISKHRLGRCEHVGEQVKVQRSSREGVGRKRARKA